MNDLAIPEFPATSGLSKPAKTFRPAGPVVLARLSSSPLRGMKNPGTATAVQRAGKRYEKKVLSTIEKLFSKSDEVAVIPAPWLAFSSMSDVSAERHCQPDLLLRTPTEVLLCEVKLSHTVDAYWQLSELYRPVVERLVAPLPVRLVEITRSFDPVVKFPARMRLFFSIEHILRTPATEAIEVLQWKL